MKIRLPEFGFWSYARKDDTYSDLRVSQLCEYIRQQVELDLGRDVGIFQDTSSITYGAEWEERITDAISRSSFLIAVLTPTFIRRPWCFNEVRLFLEREARLRAEHPSLRHESLIFPIAYRAFRPEEAIEPELMAMLAKRQWFKIDSMIDHDLSDRQLRRELRRLVSDIKRLLEIEIESEAERGAREARERANLAQQAEREREAERIATLAAEARRRDEEARRTEAAAEETARRLAQERKAAEAAKARRQRRIRREPRWWERPAAYPLRNLAVGGMAVALLVAVVAAFAGGFSALLRPPRDVRVPVEPAPVPASAPAEGPAAPAKVAAAPVPTWLHRAWGIDGDCSSTIRIAGDGRRLIVRTPSSKQYERAIVGTPTATEVVTADATYTRAADGSMQSSEPALKDVRLTECPVTGV